MRRAFTIVALLACVVYSTLAPMYAAMGHGVLMRSPSLSLAAPSPEARLEQSLKTAICHGGTAAADVASDVAELPADQPSNDGSGCPVCKGLAGAQLAILVAAEFGWLVREAHAVDAPIRDETVDTIVSPTPRSRGPPLPV